MTSEVRVSAPAKINLHLGVGQVRPDGFHPLVTVFQALGLYDELTLRPARTSSLTVSGEDVDVTAVPTGSSNLVLRAVEALAAHHGRTDLAVSCHLRKRIPVAGGLAGGSTDAAAALVGVDSLFELHTPRQELHDLAAGLGSDVPFCLHGGTALGTGRGEELAPLMSRGDYWWVLLPDDEGLSTPAVYSAYDLLGHHAEPEPPTELLAALRVGDVARVGELLHNDLAPPACSLRPDLAEVVAAGEECGAFGGLVSGSGPTVAFLCGDAEHAAYVDGRLQETLGTAPGIVVKAPAHGARVVGARVGGIYQ
ncbi:4-(cytidine 5'-diphospho)-2-C-methyl-D-erythritol kinase [Nocardioides marmoribigeumensis]|jgi:4-diphosphocytidyl-2-C-methyl-D-erythritol kinase|uniref:4-diphosphocytidyl-2-C-methyl-D-erythritol kinase n=1 Tax=Nocardioides marmoribigeumensis TaxID=433649 RepID=A0ABU2BZF5_9ACTN|nr:4-(cytidine 5'-diphospho)-2-C-methyl-D-erythritol kinase [Nocardioides marmoribigeumensis]MDR7363790.1 4-diphosphocytidyl-2-C-methyl-D-erythritol kinase [Nocardioides marmoribigeumensis]